MAKKRTKCKMCKVKRKLWENGKFFSVNCRKHFVPLIILNEHRDEITSEEMAEVDRLIQIYYPKLFKDDRHQCSDGHWHIHLCKQKR